MLAVGRALMARPRLLMLDEPSLGLAPQLVAEMFRYLRRLSQEQGLTILLVEQQALLALTIADRAYVLVNGRVAISGRADDLRANPEVQRVYLGGA
jgi:branched-chain amino acid transport system ATP-binding protein